MFDVSDTTARFVPGQLAPKSTAVTPKKPVPVIVTVVLPVGGPLVARTSTTTPCARALDNLHATGAQGVIATLAMRSGAIKITYGHANRTRRGTSGASHP